MRAEPAMRVVIFIDEIDTTLNLEFKDDFFAAIRSLHNARGDTPAKAVIVCTHRRGIAERSYSNPGATPFNIGHRVDLADFSIEQAKPLARGLNLRARDASRVLRWVWKWTGGHPYLSVRLCQEIASAEKKTWSEHDIDQLVARTFFGEMSSRDSNLQFVRSMLTSKAPDIEAILQTYRQIRAGKKIPDEQQSFPKSHLKLSGVVRGEGLLLRVRNQIYETVFDERWVKEQLPRDRERLKRVAEEQQRIAEEQRLEAERQRQIVLGHQLARLAST